MKLELTCELSNGSGVSTLLIESFSPAVAFSFMSGRGRGQGKGSIVRVLVWFYWLNMFFFQLIQLISTRDFAVLYRMFKKFYSQAEKNKFETSLVGELWCSVCGGWYFYHFLLEVGGSLFKNWEWATSPLCFLEKWATSLELATC